MVEIKWPDVVAFAEEAISAGHRDLERITPDDQANFTRGRIDLARALLKLGEKPVPGRTIQPPAPPMPTGPDY